jgi:HEPN domain-containing protein
LPIKADRRFIILLSEWFCISLFLVLSPPLCCSSLMPNRADDWLQQAGRDLDRAEDSRRSSRHEWACFAAKQAAEKAVKALHLYLGQEARGHVIAKLLRELPNTVQVPESLVEKGRVPNTFYIPPRYPNSHPEGAPFQYYGPLQSEEAIRYAGQIIELVRLCMA